MSHSSSLRCFNESLFRIGLFTSNSMRFFVKYNASKFSKPSNVEGGKVVNLLLVKSKNLRFLFDLNASTLIRLILFSLKWSSVKLTRPVKVWLWISTKPHFAHSKFFSVFCSKIRSSPWPLNVGLELNRSVSKRVWFRSSSKSSLSHLIELWLRSIMSQVLFIANSLISLIPVKLLKVLSKTCDDEALKWIKWKAFEKRKTHSSMVRWNWWYSWPALI